MVLQAEKNFQHTYQMTQGDLLITSMFSKAQTLDIP